MAEEKKERGVKHESDQKRIKRLSYASCLYYFTFYYAGDNLDSVEWEERSITQLSNFNEKTKIPVLALELAHRIENDNLEAHR